MKKPRKPPTPERATKKILCDEEVIQRAGDGIRRCATGGLNALQTEELIELDQRYIQRYDEIVAD